MYIFNYVYIYSTVQRVNNDSTEKCVVNYSTEHGLIIVLRNSVVCNNCVIKNSTQQLVLNNSTENCLLMILQSNIAEHREHLPC